MSNIFIQIDYEWWFLFFVLYANNRRHNDIRTKRFSLNLLDNDNNGRMLYVYIIIVLMCDHEYFKRRVSDKFSKKKKGKKWKIPRHSLLINRVAVPPGPDSAQSITSAVCAPSFGVGVRVARVKTKCI